MKWWFVLLFLGFIGCNVPKRVQYHKTRIEKLGGQLTTDTLTICHIDSFPVIVNDTIVWERTYRLVDTVYTWKVSKPKTRWQTRIEYRERIKTLQVKGDTEVRVVKAKQEVKWRINWWLVLCAYLFGFFTIPIIKGLLKRP